MKQLLLRVVILYFLILISMKIMGKRQVGQMQMTELVTTLFLSELATYCVAESSVPIMNGILAILIIIFLEITISFLSVKVPIVKMLFDFSPETLIWEGEILEKGLVKARLTIDELLSLLRLCGYPDITEVRFAFLEANGQVSVVPFPDKKSLCISDMNLSPKPSSFSIAIIDDGVINRKALKRIGRDERWLKKTVKKLGNADVKSYLLLCSDLDGNLKQFPKEE